MQQLSIRFVSVAIGLGLAACAPDDGAETLGGDAAAPSERPAAQSAAALLPADRGGRIALGPAHDSAWALYEMLRERANGGAPLTPGDMPDWTGLWTRTGNPFFDPEQSFDELTTAALTPDALAELETRRGRSAEGIEYDPISDCSPPGFPRWLAIPFLREFIVTPHQVWLTSETVNNVRRIYTDGRGHLPEEDSYPLWYGDSIGFWHGQTLVIHTNSIRDNVFHRNDPRHSDQVAVVEVWQKLDADTIVADVWAYDPITLVEPWYVRQTYKRLSNPDGSLRVRYWHCSENPNNAIVQTEEGSSTFGDFEFTDGEN